MDAHAETSAHIAHLGIAVDARQQSEAVDDEHLGLGSLLGRGLRIAHHAAPLEQLHDLAQMVLADHVRGYDEFPVAVAVEVRYEDFLIGLPRASGTEHAARIGAEGLHDGQLLAGLLDLQHAVEAGVAHHPHVLDAQGAKQQLALLVLHKEGGEARQHLGIAPSVPLEEHLVPAEDARHAVGGHTAVLQHMQVVVPELILDEERHHRAHRAQEAAGVAHGVERQVAHDVGARIVLPHLIARGREERKQDLVFGMDLAQTLHERTPLLELSQRGGVKPDVFGLGVKMFAQHAERGMLATPHLPHLLIEQRVDEDSESI